jgi:hypothetical protein
MVAATLALAVVLLLPASAAAEAVAAPDDAAPAAPASDRDAGARRRAEVPSTMVLCRGPRGAVYARDASSGCRHAQLDATNLVGFGEAEDCVLRRAAAGEAEEPPAKAARDCDDVCAASGDERTCAVGLHRVGGAWETFTPARQLDEGDPALQGALVVCCRP